MRDANAIDPDIQDLVAAMNNAGLHTYASCQGHGFPCDKLQPYVAFYAPVQRVRVLEERLRQDMESPTPGLRWGWWLSASFDGEFRLAWRLQPAGPHQWLFRYERRTVKHDLFVLTVMIASLSEQLKRIDDIERPPISNYSPDKLTDYQQAHSALIHVKRAVVTGVPDITSDISRRMA